MAKRLQDQASKARQEELKKSALQVATQTHTYVCDEGHWVTSPDVHDHCPAYVKGSPCTGQLTRVGKPKK